MQVTFKTGIHCLYLVLLFMTGNCAFECILVAYPLLVRHALLTYANREAEHVVVQHVVLEAHPF